MLSDTMRHQTQKPALVLSRVNACFADDKNTYALKDISLSIPAGAFVSIVGPSGAGKSTLTRIILGMMEPTSGTIIRNFSQPAMVFQNYALFPWLTARENVAFGLNMQGVNNTERNRIVREKLEEIGLLHVEHHYPVALSGGQRQRIGLARALAVSPDLLIMDEPFSNLDTITSATLKADLLRIWSTYTITILMVNHLIPDAIELSDRIIVMGAHPGRVEKILSVDLPRPRNIRSNEFYTHVDRLTNLIQSIS